LRTLGAGDAGGPGCGGGRSIIVKLQVQVAEYLIATIGNATGTLAFTDKGLVDEGLGGIVFPFQQELSYAWENLMGIIVIGILG
jgi:hypothetical protein